MTKDALVCILIHKYIIHYLDHTRILCHFCMRYSLNFHLFELLVHFSFTGLLEEIQFRFLLRLGRKVRNNISFLWSFHPFSFFGW